MATVETDASTNQSVAELRSIKRQAKFTNVMMSIGVGVLISFTNQYGYAQGTYFAIIAVVVCLAMR